MKSMTYYVKEVLSSSWWENFIRRVFPTYQSKESLYTHIHRLEDENAMLSLQKANITANFNRAMDQLQALNDTAKKAAEVATSWQSIAIEEEKLKLAALGATSSATTLATGLLILLLQSKGGEATVLLDDVVAASNDYTYEVDKLNSNKLRVKKTYNTN